MKMVKRALQTGLLAYLVDLGTRHSIQIEVLVSLHDGEKWRTK
jgi:hypothetical protein